MTDGQDAMQTEAMAQEEVQAPADLLAVQGKTRGGT